jgi:hypothetical protein
MRHVPCPIGALARSSRTALDRIATPLWIGLKSHRPFTFAGLWDLGYCAVQCLLDGGTAAMVSIQHGRCTPIPFMLLVDPVSGWANVRRVDSTAQS